MRKKQPTHWQRHQHVFRESLLWPFGRDYFVIEQCALIISMPLFSLQSGRQTQLTVSELAKVRHVASVWHLTKLWRGDLMHANDQQSRGITGADPGSTEQPDKCPHPHSVMAVYGARSHKRIMCHARVVICNPNTWRNESLLATWMNWKSIRTDKVILHYLHSRHFTACHN